jgi:hypothetical protein
VLLPPLQALLLQQVQQLLLALQLPLLALPLQQLLQLLLPLQRPLLLAQPLWLQQEQQVQLLA